LVDVPVTFVLRWHDDVSPASGFFIDGNTGEQLIRIPAIPGTFSAALQATAAGASPVTLYSTNFTFAAPDTANPINGPAGKDCASQDQQVDSIEFDHRFTCDCSDDASSNPPNCEVTAAASASDSSLLSSTLSFGVVGAVIGIVLVIVAVSRYQIHRLRNTPEDLSEAQDEILTHLGMHGAAMSIPKGQVGLSVVFGPSMAKHASESTNRHELAEKYAVELLAALRKLSGLPRSLVDMLRLQGTDLVVDPVEGVALLRMKDRQGMRQGALENYAAALHLRAFQRKISIDGQYFVQDVSVAIPKRVPKELDRRMVVRLNQLGEGNFGEV
jgi:hypothetical protein